MRQLSLHEELVPVGYIDSIREKPEQAGVQMSKVRFVFDLAFKEN
jgi:hypothetical protein